MGKTILNDWNDAVLKGAAALDAIDETANNSTLNNILTAYSDEALGTVHHLKLQNTTVADVNFRLGAIVQAQVGVSSGGPSQRSSLDDQPSWKDWVSPESWPLLKQLEKGRGMGGANTTTTQTLAPGSGGHDASFGDLGGTPIITFEPREGVLAPRAEMTVKVRFCPQACIPYCCRIYYELLRPGDTTSGSPAAAAAAAGVDGPITGISGSASSSSPDLAFPAFSITLLLGVYFALHIINEPTNSSTGWSLWQYLQ